MAAEYSDIKKEDVIEKIGKDEWTSIIKGIDSLDIFKCVAKEIFSDNKNVKRRLIVLEFVARDVGEETPLIKRAVWNEYLSIIDKMLVKEKHYALLCWLCDKNEKYKIGENIARSLLNYFVQY